jgi:hypothetical protein
MVIAQLNSRESRCVADFLLAWLNAEHCGGFDMAALRDVSHRTACDMAIVFIFIASRRIDPASLGYADQFRRLLWIWRSELRGVAA